MPALDPLEHRHHLMKRVLPVHAAFILLGLLGPFFVTTLTVRKEPLAP
ncbi:hypothetical protein [Pseudomonas sp. 4810-S13]